MTFGDRRVHARGNPGQYPPAMEKLYSAASRPSAFAAG